MSNERSCIGCYCYGICSIRKDVDEFTNKHPVFDGIPLHQYIASRCSYYKKDREVY